MRVLWISPNGGNFNSQNLKGTGGWIPSLQNALSSIKDLHLAIAFVNNDYDSKVVGNDATYYPIKREKRSNISKLIARYTNGQQKEEKSYINRFIEIIEDFKPDLIHIWGVENFYSRIAMHTDIPCVIHIQGIATSCVNAYMPPCFSISQLKKADSFLNCMLKRCLYNAFQQLVTRAENEIEVSKVVKYWIGRTEWDRKTIAVLSPDSTYFHCDEVLREDFFEGSWQYKQRDKIVIQSTIADVPYKGIDIVLKTARILKELGVDFIWNVCGVGTNSRWTEYCSKKLNIVPNDVNVVLHGSVENSILKGMLLDCDVYFHSSYIDNSPNAVAEAQLLGVPAIAMNVGGLETMLQNQTGLLIQANDPFIAAYSIVEMKREDVATRYSDSAKVEVTKRHDKEKIVCTLIENYKTIIKNDCLSQNL